MTGPPLEESGPAPARGHGPREIAIHDQYGARGRHAQSVSAPGLLEVLRRTYGAFGAPKAVPLSIGAIARSLRIARSRVGHVVAELLEARVLVAEVDPGRTISAPRSIGPNKDHEQWSLPVASARRVASARPVAPARRVPPCVDRGVPIGATPDRCRPAPFVAPPPARDFFETSSSPNGDDVAASPRRGDKRRASSKKSKTAPTDPRVAEFLKHYPIAFEERFGRAPIDGASARTATLTRDALRALDTAGEADALEALKDLLARYFTLAERDGFYRGAPLGKFLAPDTLQRLRADVPTARKGPTAYDLALRACAELATEGEHEGTLYGRPARLRRDADGTLLATVRDERRDEIVGRISRGLKALARETGIAVLAAAQLNRAVEAREGHKPRLSDLRESGAVEQDADVVVALSRETVERGEHPDPSGRAKAIEVAVLKHRGGPTGVVAALFEPAAQRLAEAARSAPPAGWTGKQEAEEDRT